MTKALAITFSLMLLAVGMADALPRPVLILCMVPFCVTCLISGKMQEAERARRAQERRAKKFAE